MMNRSRTLSLVALLLAGCSKEVEVGVLASAAPGLPSTVSAACDPGAPTGLSTIASGLDASSNLPVFLDGEVLYLATYAGVRKVPLAGGSPTTLDAASHATVDIAVVDGVVYAAGYHGIRAVPVGGGAAVPLYEPPSAERLIVGQLAADTASLYWLERFPGDEASPGDSWLMTMPLGGGEATELLSLGDDSYGLVVDAEKVYWTQVASDQVRAMPKGGGVATTLASQLHDPGQMAMDDANLYWLQKQAGPTDNSSELRKMAKGGGKSTAIAPAAHVSEVHGGLVVNATSAFWVQYSGPPESARLTRTPLSGGVTEVVAEFQGVPVSRPIACPGGVCWTAYNPSLPPASGGALYRYNHCP
jgi:hypothetical protein